MLSGGVHLVNARAVAAERGIEVVESRSTRARNFTSLMSVKLHTSDGERWVEGTVFEQGEPRLVLLDGVPVEAPLDGTLIVIRNDDTPGVIGEVGTMLGRTASTSPTSRSAATRTARSAWSTSTNESMSASKSISRCDATVDDPGDQRRPS